MRKKRGDKEKERVTQRAHRVFSQCYWNVCSMLYHWPLHGRKAARRLCSRGYKDSGHLRGITAGSGCPHSCSMCSCKEELNSVKGMIYLHSLRDYPASQSEEQGIVCTCLRRFHPDERHSPGVRCLPFLPSLPKAQASPAQHSNQIDGHTSYRYTYSHTSYR